jgi:hypothetical protein
LDLSAALGTGPGSQNVVDVSALDLLDQLPQGQADCLAVLLDVARQLPFAAEAVAEMWAMFAPSST